jgi:transposase-like protein
MKKLNKRREAIVAEYLAGEMSYRDLEARHGISSSTLQRWVKAAEAGSGTEKPAAAADLGREVLGAGVEDVSKEVKRLRAELRKAELHNKLLNTMIDIAEKQMGIDIRKKSGAKR